MGAIQEIKEKFSTQDLGIYAALGTIGGVFTSRFFEAMAIQGGIVSGAVLGGTTYAGQLIAGEDASPMRTVTATVFSLALITFALIKGAPALTTRFGFQIIPSDPKALIALAGLNGLGHSMIIYFPVLFPSFLTAPILPTKLKELNEMSSKQVRECHGYYEANPEAFTALPIKSQFVLEQAFTQASLSSLASPSLTSFADWELEDVTYASQQSWSFDSPLFQCRCYEVGLEPPTKISESFALPADVPSINKLDEKQQRWFKQLFETHPKKWNELSPAKQMAFCQFDAFAHRKVDIPTTVEHVEELSPDGVILLHRDFNPDAYDKKVGLALIQRFIEEKLKLPTNLQKQIEALPDLTTPEEVRTLSLAKQDLYALLFKQAPSRWSSLAPTVHWAFCAISRLNWPPMRPPSELGEIRALSQDRATYFHKIFSSELVANAELRYELIVKFYEFHLAPTPEMVTDCLQYLKANSKTNPFQDFSMVAQVQSLKPEQLQWFAEIYRGYRGAWIALPMNYQVQFMQKSPALFNFLTLTYPISKSQVAALDAEALKAFQATFDISIMDSTGRRFGATFFGSSPLDNQSPELFKLSKAKRNEILRLLATTFKLPLPPGFQNHINPPNTLEAIAKLDQAQLRYWSNYFNADPEKWHDLHLTFQVEFKRHAQPVDASLFPALYIQDEHLRNMAEQGHTDHSRGVDPVLPDQNAFFLEIQYLLNHTPTLSMTQWVQWKTNTQDALNQAFADLGIEHNIPVVDVAIPNNPPDAVTVNGIAAEMLKAYHENFHPGIFEGVHRDAIFDAFLARFSIDAPPVGVLGHHKKLLQNIGLSKPLTAAEKAWAHKVLVPGDGTHVVWDSLSCQEQLIYKSDFASVAFGIPDGTHFFKAPTLEEAQTLPKSSITRLHAYYQSTNALKAAWLQLPDPIQHALNLRFEQEKLAVLVTPWNMTHDRANALSNEEGAALRAFFDTHEGVWHSYPQLTIQAVLNPKFDRQFALGATTDEQRTIGYYYDVLAKHHIPRLWREKVASHLPNMNIKSRIEPYLTKRNAIITTAGVVYIVTDLTGIPNGVPDVILETGLSIAGTGLGWGGSALRFATVDVIGGTLGLGWTATKGTLGLGWSALKWGGSSALSLVYSSGNATETN